VHQASDVIVTGAWIIVNDVKAVVLTTDSADVRPGYAVVRAGRSVGSIPIRLRGSGWSRDARGLESG
jgi:hypothetical protein